MKERGLARRNGQQLSSAVLNLNFEDLPIIVNGTATDAVADNKPFDLHFTKDKILWSWAKVGFVPFTRSCLENRRVRKELGQHNKDSALEDLRYRYNLGDGFNPGIFDAVIPTAAHVHRAATENAQIEELLKSGKAFSASGQWKFCDSRIGNCETLPSTAAPQTVTRLGVGLGRSRRNEEERTQKREGTNAWRYRYRMCDG